ncbi:hypothetical protein RB653_002476 [Dictyostelium firmibasis]|uniref:Uncharacterized protein n=1 Tax=Dictyostelium firmibasis TaxID=79012 RepID=A0AAN7U960_9MYCE
MKSIFIYSLLLIFFLISISVTTSTTNNLFLNHQVNNKNDNNIFLSEDKSINDIINKGYNKLIRNLKSNNLYHNDELKYQKLAIEKEKSKPMGYKCQHDHIINQHKLRTQQELKNNNNNFEIQKLQNTTTTTTTTTITTTAAAAAITSAPIRFKIDTSYINGTYDQYACYKVGDVVPIGSTSATNACKTDGSIYPCLKTCVAEDLQSTAYQKFLITSIVETMVEIFETRLKVINPQNSFKFNYNSNGGYCNYGVPIPGSFYTTGISNTDMYVYVTSRPYSSPDTIAYAAPCNYATGSILGRPTGAIINFCPSYFTQFVGQENSIQYNMFVRAGIHEMTHALGFSNSFYSSYVVPNTKTVIRNGKGASESYTFSGTTPSGQSYSVSKGGIFSDKVVQFAKDHYGCDSITNVELEDLGGSGTAGSHWEMRTVGEEYMLGYISPTMPITDLTMSILEDSGWYEITYNTQEQLVYGKGLGCDFVQKMCSPKTWNYTGYFCSTNGQASCTGTRAAKGICRIIDYGSPLPPLYQHFTNPNLVGSLITSDGCPIAVVENYNSYCFDTSKQSTANTNVYEEFTENSKCFEYKNPTNKQINQACWQQRCLNSTLQIKINTEWFNCPDSSTVVSNGITVVCPTSYNICSTMVPSSSSSSTSSSSSSTMTTSSSTTTSSQTTHSSSTTTNSREDINSTSILLPSLSLLLLLLFITINIISF